MNPSFNIISGPLSGAPIHLHDVNSTALDNISIHRFVKNGQSVPDFSLDSTVAFPDQLSFRKKFGLLIPVTNTAMEYELWKIIMENRDSGGLNGVGIHTTGIQLPALNIQTPADLEHFKEVFIGGLDAAIKQAMQAKPEYLIMGMSLEHILNGIEPIRQLMGRVQTDISWATWHQAADAALKKCNARRIGFISPFIKKGNDHATRMFEDLGYEVVSSFGFGCPDLVDIAHIPDAAKEEAILRHVATPENRLDAVLQLGTNMSLARITDRIEDRIGIPVLGINAVTFWYALRENGFNEPLKGAGRLLREF